MYTAPQKKFALRDEDETLESIRRLGQFSTATAGAARVSG
jgi:hypothetical protein